MGLPSPPPHTHTHTQTSNAFGLFEVESTSFITGPKSGYGGPPPSPTKECPFCTQSLMSLTRHACDVNRLTYVFTLRLPLRPPPPPRPNSWLRSVVLHYPVVVLLNRDVTSYEDTSVISRRFLLRRLLFGAPRAFVYVLVILQHRHTRRAAWSIYTDTRSILMIITLCIRPLYTRGQALKPPPPPPTRPPHHHTPLDQPSMSPYHER